jgi:iron complex outermembrane recepter protein
MKRMRSFLMCAALASVGVETQFVQRVHAADSNAPQMGVELVVVTAEKRETLLQKTPIAITAISATRIDDQQLNSLDHLQFAVPSLTFGQQSGYSFISLRGITTDATDISGDPAVGTYVDGVYIGTMVVQNVPDQDLERIEVLRGPQGTLYGRNTTGGVINYVTKAPSFTPEASSAATIGSYDEGAVDAGLTGPISDTLAYRLSFHLEQHDGYRDDINLNTHQDNLNQWGGKGSLLYTPTNDISITFRGDYVHQQTSDPYVFLSGKSYPASSPLDALISPSLPLGVFSEPASYFENNPGLLSPADITKLNGGSIAQYFGFHSIPGPPPTDPFKTTDTATGYPIHYDVKNGGGSVTLDWNLGDMALKSITAYRHGEMNAAQDAAGYSVAVSPLDPLAQRSNQFTQEINLSGSSFDNRLKWLTGLFYLHDRTQFDTMVWLPQFSEYFIANTSLASAGPYSFNLSQPLNRTIFQIPTLLATAVVTAPNIGGTGIVRPNDITSLPQTAFIGFLAKQASESEAVYGQATYDVTDKLHIDAGLRFTRDEKHVDITEHSNLIVLFGGAAGLCQDHIESNSWNALTGTGGVDYDVSDGIMIYGKYSRGYRAGGFSGNSCSNSFKPEFLSDFEGGVKSVFADHQIQLNLAGFHYDYTNIQVTTFVQNATQRLNAGAAELYGLEAEYFIVPNALPGFKLDGSGTWNHSEYTRGSPFTPNGCFVDTSGLYCLKIVGNELQRAPEFKFNVGGQYQFDLGDHGKLALRGDVAWTDTYYNDIFNGKAPFQSDMTQPAYWILNAHINWESASGRYYAQLFGENLLNTAYTNNRISINLPPLFNVVSGQFAAPRTFGLKFGAKLDGF